MLLRLLLLFGNMLSSLMLRLRPFLRPSLLLPSLFSFIFCFVLRVEFLVGRFSYLVDLRELQPVRRTRCLLFWRVVVICLPVLISRKKYVFVDLDVRDHRLLLLVPSRFLESADLRLRVDLSLSLLFCRIGFELTDRGIAHFAINTSLHDIRGEPHALLFRGAHGLRLLDLDSHVPADQVLHLDLPLAPAPCLFALLAASGDHLFALHRTVLDPELGVLWHSLRPALENEFAPLGEVEILALVLLGLVPVLALVAAEELLLVLRPLREPLVVAVQVEALALGPQLLIILQGDEF